MILRMRGSRWRIVPRSATNRKTRASSPSTNGAAECRRAGRQHEMAQSELCASKAHLIVGGQPRRTPHSLDRAGRRARRNVLGEPSIHIDQDLDGRIVEPFPLRLRRPPATRRIRRIRAIAKPMAQARGNTPAIGSASVAPCPAARAARLGAPFLFLAMVSMTRLWEQGRPNRRLWPQN